MNFNFLGRTRGGPVGELKHDFGLVHPLGEDQLKKNTLYVNSSEIVASVMNTFFEKALERAYERKAQRFFM